MAQRIANQKKENGMSFEERLWETAEQLRGKVEVSNYKYVAMGLMFLKFISERYNLRRNEIEQETRNPKSDNYCKSQKDRMYLLDLKDQYTSRGVFYLKEGNRWADITKIVASEPNLAIKIDDMLINIEKENPPLENVLPKIFASSNISNDNLKELIELFDSIKIEKEEEIAKDTFGRIYEFFMKKFSKRELSRGGEFFTPESIVRLLVEILEPYQGIIYDPTCGSGGMFVQSYKFLDAHRGNLQRRQKTGISIYGVESQTGIWRICKMNLAIRGIESKNIKNDDCLVGHPFPDLKANRIMANPPFNLREWGYEKMRGDKQFSKYGMPSYSKAGGNYAFMEHMIYHMDEKDGRLGLVLANGSMSAEGQERKIREAIVRSDLVDCMIALGTNLFFTVTIAACLWFLTKNKDDGETRKRNGETLFIDARKIYTKVDRVLNELSPRQIEKIAGTYRSFIGEDGYPKYEDIPGYCKVATIDEIEKNNFILTPGRYVGAEEIDEGEPFEEKMRRLAKQYIQLSGESQKLDMQIHKNLKEMGFGF